MGELNYETRHKLRQHDFEVLKDFDFKYAPVGFKFLNVEADLEGLGLEQLDAEIAWCQMLLEAQKGKTFYATAKNQFCEPGVFLSGHGELSALAAGGRLGPPFDIYPDERSNRRVYNHLTVLPAGSTFATAFSPVDKLTFEPDLLILMCDTMTQGERVLRATQWDTGDMIESRMTYVMGCNWLFTYPYVSGKINTVWTGVAYGMKMYKLYPPGMPIVVIPWNHIDRVLRNIREMPTVLPGHTDLKHEAYERGYERLGVRDII
ncbi:MAG: hypothetical protein A2133_07635 [Actinobacteria bacterium RBG_16_64_13]|nr:MAG: hypothetical protein A2133_07635 [Actinobacteria bacterium RBG_16_64_13]